MSWQIIRRWISNLRYFSVVSFHAETLASLPNARSRCCRSQFVNRSFSTDLITNMSLLEGPPPPGIDIYADQRSRIIGSSVAIIVITITSVGLRLLSRKLSRAGFWWDDYLTIVALIFSAVGVLIWLIGRNPELMIQSLAHGFFGFRAP